MALRWGLASPFATGIEPFDSAGLARTPPEAQHAASDAPVKEEEQRQEERRQEEQRYMQTIRLDPEAESRRLSVAQSTPAQFSRGGQMDSVAHGQEDSGLIPTPHAFDIIGDVHGELPALQQLGRNLGYDVDAGWTHPDNRLLVFLGDLVDRGAHSLEVGELVRDLVAQRRAVCIMGNHEYNLVAYHLGVEGYGKPKHSNRATIAAINADTTGRWPAVLAFFRDLPIGIDLPDLRIIHACWHRQSVKDVAPQLRVTLPRAGVGADAMAWVEAHVTLRSPFTTTGLLSGLPGDTEDMDADVPHEVLIKGFEVPAKPFRDNDGKERDRVREVWWQTGTSDTYLMEKPQVFGHYWNVPPVEGDFAPPHPSGHPDLRDWGLKLVASGKIATSGQAAMTGEFACVDFNGVTRASKHLACVGALRWPEREMWWATAGKTAASGGNDD